MRTRIRVRRSMNLRAPVCVHVHMCDAWANTCACMCVRVCTKTHTHTHTHNHNDHHHQHSLTTSYTSPTTPPPPKKKKKKSANTHTHTMREKERNGESVLVEEPESLYNRFRNKIILVPLLPLLTSDLLARKSPHDCITAVNNKIIGPVQQVRELPSCKTHKKPCFNLSRLLSVTDFRTWKGRMNAILALFSTKRFSGRNRTCT